jgi:2,3-bisphosphoglycerate-dependent phosphoglycerate mutase
MPQGSFVPHLILVKHALPEIIPTSPAKQWHLSEVGRAQCALLADQLAIYAPAVLVASPEPKALETAHLVAQQMHASVRVMDGLQEHDRSNTAWLGPEEFDRAIAAFFRYPAELVLGCETAQQASERFTRTVAEVTSHYVEQNVVVFTHGTVLSLYVARATGMEPFALWKSLSLPSFVVLTFPQFEIIRVVEKMPLTLPAAARTIDEL